MKQAALYRLDNCHVVDCCQKYTVTADFRLEPGCPVSWEHPGEGAAPDVREVRIDRAVSTVFGVDCEMKEPAGGWPKDLLDYLARELETDRRFVERAQELLQPED